MIRAHAHLWPRIPAGQAAPPHIFRWCPPACPRIRPAAALRACSVRQHDCFFPPNRCYAHPLRVGTVAVAIASSGPSHPSPPPLRHTNSLPAQRAPPVSASCIFTVCPCFTLLPCPFCPAPILQSPIRRSSHAATRPLCSDAGRLSAGRFR